MALRIKRKENVQKAARRIGRRLARKALKALRECETLDAVHEVRKDIKQSRALLRLMRCGLSGGSYGRLTKKLKKTAAALAPSRDAFVKTSALEALVIHFKHDSPQPHFPAIKRALTDHCQKHLETLPGDLKGSRRLLKQIACEFKSTRAAGSGWKVIGPGIRKTYRDGRRAYQLAGQTGAAEDFHEWRKRAKDLLYQAGFICRIWPEQMDALKDDMKKLGDCLGDAHDLSVLTGRDTLGRRARQPKEETQTLTTLADQRQEELQAKALQLGAKLYDEKTKVFCKRLKQYWKRWRRGRRVLSALS